MNARTAAAALLLALAACSSGPDPEEATQAVLERAAFLMGQQNAALGGQDPRALEVIESDLERLAKQHRGILLAEAASAEPDRRAAALFTLGYAGTRDVVAPLAAATADPDESIRVHAIAALGTPGLPDAPTEPFARLLRDDSPVCRTAALFALRRSGLAAGDPALRAAVAAAFQDRSSDVRNEAAITAGLAGAGELVGPLTLLAGKDLDPVVRRNAALSLGRIGAPARPSTAALVEMLRDEDTRVVEGAWKALCVIHDKDMDRSYTKWRDWFEDEAKHHYVCAEHPEAPQAVAGTCPRCPKKLDRLPKEGTRKGLTAWASAVLVYGCSEHPEVVTTAPARCGKSGCGKELAARKADPVLYACPDHAEVQTSTPARCGKSGCGKDLVPAKP